MTQEQLEGHIRELAKNRCEIKHPGYYRSVGQRSCYECLAETKREYKEKEAKAHGRLLSPEEAAEEIKKLGLE